MCLIVHSWFGRDLGDGVMLGSTLGILITTLKITLSILFYILINGKQSFMEKGFPTYTVFLIYDIVILISFLIIFIGGKKCSSALLVTGLISLLVGTIAELLSLCINIVWWISRGQQLQASKDDEQESSHPGAFTTAIVTSLFILTAIYLAYLLYFILTVSSYIAQIGEIRVR